MNLEPLKPSRRKSYPEVGTPEVRRKIGQDLRSAREFINYSIDQVSATTKINGVFLESLEEGDWSFLPSTYIKLFIRAYGEAVNMKMDLLNNKLNELFGSSSSTTAMFQSSDREIKQPGIDRISGIMTWAERNRSILFYSLLLVIVVILFVYFLFPSKPMEISETAIETQPESSISQEPGYTSGAIIDSSDLVQAIQPESLSQTAARMVYLEVYAIDTCYVKIMHADNLIYERTLWPKNRFRREIPAPGNVLLGNAPGVRLIVDGDSLPPFPENRPVRSVIIGRD